MISMESLCRQHVMDDEEDELQLLIDEILLVLQAAEPELLLPPAADAHLLSPCDIFTPNTSICQPVMNLSCSTTDQNEVRSEILACFVLRDMRLMPFYGSPFHRGGEMIRRGDILAAINGQRINTIQQFVEWEERASLIASQENYFTILRDGRKIVVRTMN